MRASLERGPKADPAMAAAAACGFAYALLIPFHGLVRAATEISLIFAWKEVVLAAGLIFSILYGLKQAARRPWPFVAITLVLMMVYIGSRSVGADLLIVADGSITVFGPICVGIFYWTSFGKALATRTTPGPLLFILGLAGLLAVWIAAEDRLGLTRLTTGDEDFAFFTREGITRARASFDSPMSAGQWLWLHAVVAFGCALSEARARAAGILLVLAALMALGILFTGSRGPYALILLSVAVFAAVAAFSGRLAVLLNFALMLAVLAMLVGPWVVGVALKDNAVAVGEIAGSMFDADEGANVIRAERWQAGWELASEDPIWGTGVENISLKHLVATGNIFENTFLDTAVALGIPGIIYALVWYSGLTVLAFAYQRRLPRNTPLVLLSLALCLWLPWAVYGFVYPTLNTRIGAAVSWAILGCAVAGYEARKRSLLTPNTH